MPLPKNPFLSRGATEKNGHGKAYERRAASSLGARLTPNSGATKASKGDMKLSRGDFRFLLESKTTINATLPVDFGWLVKISEEASGKGALPALLFSFVTPEGRPLPRAPSEWVAIPRHVFDELTNAEGTE